jgi:RNA polymerase sigma-70 factor (ECF subfamily)
MTVAEFASTSPHTRDKPKESTMNGWFSNAALLAIVMSCGTTWAADAKEKPSVQNLPPVVVKTVPQAGDTKVDPAIKEIKVTFSKKMTDGSWSWAGADESWTAGKPHYLPDGKTCVLPVKLEPGKTYVVWANSPSFGNFKDTKGRSSLPYLLVFETKEQ